VLDNVPGEPTAEAALWALARNGSLLAVFQR
jgi:hypothetical protein